jgi:hypothetical protein
MMGDADEEIQDRLLVDIFNRFLNLVLLARIGNGTWQESSMLSSFHIELPGNGDLEKV